MYQYDRLRNFCNTQLIVFEGKHGRALVDIRDCEAALWLDRCSWLHR